MHINKESDSIFWCFAADSFKPYHTLLSFFPSLSKQKIKSLGALPFGPVPKPQWKPKPISFTCCLKPFWGQPWKFAVLYLESLICKKYIFSYPLIVCVVSSTPVPGVLETCTKFWVGCSLSNEWPQQQAHSINLTIILWIILTCLNKWISDKLS